MKTAFVAAEKIWKIQHCSNYKEKYTAHVYFRLFFSLRALYAMMPYKLGNKATIFFKIRSKCSLRKHQKIWGEIRRGWKICWNEKKANCFYFACFRKYFACFHKHFDHILKQANHHSSKPGKRISLKIINILTAAVSGVLHFWRQHLSRGGQGFLIHVDNVIETIPLLIFILLHLLLLTHFLVRDKAVCVSQLGRHTLLPGAETHITVKPRFSHRWLLWCKSNLWCCGTEARFFITNTSASLPIIGIIGSCQRTSNWTVNIQNIADRI